MSGCKNRERAAGCLGAVTIFVFACQNTGQLAPLDAELHLSSHRRALRLDERAKVVKGEINLHRVMPRERAGRGDGCTVGNTEKARLLRSVENHLPRVDACQQTITRAAGARYDTALSKCTRNHGESRHHSRHARRNRRNVGGEGKLGTRLGGSRDSFPCVGRSLSGGCDRIGLRYGGVGNGCSRIGLFRGRARSRQHVDERKDRFEVGKDGERAIDDTSEFFPG
ncbi:secreted protein [gut metagenome]|uniref:Secreted protein n=1 Tax=gut metagenome TaxID=749906 RepID=J9GJY6_9ZZZZ